jgi:hypothetical protein
MHDPIAPPGPPSKHPVDQTFLALAGPADRVGPLHHLHSGLPEVPCEADPVGAGPLDADPVKNAMATDPLQQGSIPRW